MELTETAKVVLNKRYFLPGESKWSDLCHRNANHFGNTEEEKKSFFDIMFAGDFLPNSPALMNAGTSINSFSACFVLPIEDSIDSIYKFYADAAKISKSGGGVGANYSKLRGKNACVNSTKGVASGPLSFMEVQDTSTNTIKQGGRRKGANMGILDSTHPDILDFIRYKEDKTKLTNYNLSVLLSDEFMAKIDENGPEKELWDLLCHKAWKSAEPGVLFGDTAERANNTPHLGVLNTTNPCGEQWLLNYESCSLGSINVGNFVKNGVIGWGRLEEVVKTATLLMNRILDKTIMPIPECQEALEKTRKIGVGLMGLHDLLIQMGLCYDSEEGRKLAGEVMKFIADKSNEKSIELGEKEGIYKGWGKGCPKRRNANLTTIAPTGTLSMLCDCSSGVEPYYSTITMKHVLDGEKLALVNKWFEKSLLKIFSQEEANNILDNVKEAGTINIPEVPKELIDLFKGANDISPEAHVLMQAEMQKYVDSSISKTINMPSSATVEDVDRVYRMAHKLGCKGVTVYRDGSRDEQVLNSTSTKMKLEDRPSGINFNLSPKRPKELKADIHHCSIKGSPWVVIVGLFNDMPYELFSGEMNDLYIPKTCKTGVVSKGKNGEYTLTIQIRNSNVRFDNIAHALMTPEQQALTRMVSLALRHGVHYEFIVKQLKKASGDITDFTAVVNRVLRTYIKQYLYEKEKTCTECGGKLIKMEGCEKCINCGLSKCG
jgi:ribonucleoside-diphosphate reductase alpha chain